MCLIHCVFCVCVYTRHQKVPEFQSFLPNLYVCVRVWHHFPTPQFKIYWHKPNAVTNKLRSLTYRTLSLSPLRILLLSKKF